jgi:hypothetical protein
MHEPSGDLERLKAALAEQWGITGVTAPLRPAKLQPALRKGNWQVSVALHRARQRRHARDPRRLARACTRAGFTGLPSTSAPPPSPRISATWRRSVLASAAS